MVVALVCVKERPNLITLKETNAKAPDVQVIVFGAHVGQVCDQFDYKILSNAGHSQRGANGIGFNERG